MPALSLLAVVAATAPSVPATRAGAPPTIDGRLDEPVWSQAVATDRFTQKFPHEGQPPSERTVLRILYDDGGIYVGFACEHARTRVVSRMTRRDREAESDAIAIALDPRGEGLDAYEFSVNAAGVLRDGVRFNDTDYSSDWDGNWDAKVARSASGWSAEIRIPLSIFRHRSHPVQRWGIQARRYISARGEMNEWAPIPRSAAGEVSRYGRLVDLRGLDDSNGLEYRPFVLGRVQRDLAKVGIGRGFRGTAGLDLRWRVHPDVTLDATFNPDFGQVEVDQHVLNLSTYETLLPEKRSFFLEGMEVFTTRRAPASSERSGTPSSTSRRSAARRWWTRCC